jgi:hypothetical protein
MENVGIFYGHLEYFLVIWYILWPFGNLHSGNLVYFFPALVYCVMKNLATLEDRSNKKKIAPTGIERIQNS